MLGFPEKPAPKAHKEGVPQWQEMLGFPEKPAIRADRLIVVWQVLGEAGLPSRKPAPPTGEAGFPLRKPASD
eukprot:5543241-Ditylum_brightwellii.AAC.1